MNRKHLLQASDNAQSLLKNLELAYKSYDAEVHPAISMALYGLCNQARGLFEVLTSVVMAVNSEQYTQGE